MVIKDKLIEIKESKNDLLDKDNITIIVLFKNGGTFIIAEHNVDYLLSIADERSWGNAKLSKELRYNIKGNEHINLYINGKQD